MKSHAGPTAPWDQTIGFAGGWQDLLDILPSASDGDFVPYNHGNFEILDKLYRAKFASPETTR
jgi:hypothetical protein